MKLSPLQTDANSRCGLGRSTRSDRWGPGSLDPSGVEFECRWGKTVDVRHKYCDKFDPTYNNIFTYRIYMYTYDNFETG
jgi:hypothetical protein